MEGKLISAVSELANTLMLGSLLEQLRERWGGYRLVDHFTQGEFHHDIVIELESTPNELPGAVLVVSTNCNGGIKEVFCFAERPERSALWHARCPDNPEFSGELPPVLGYAKTHHWFDPCELLTVDARSQLKPEFRQRQAGGGWTQKKPG